jgi:hypothetical protein
VTAAAPQNSCATTATSSRNPAQVGPIAVRRMWTTAIWPARAVDGGSTSTYVIATGKANPNTTATTTEATTPRATARDAERVSSARCADAA